VIPFQISYQDHNKITTTENNQPKASETEEKQVLKTTETVLAVKNGSATEIRVTVDPDSYDTHKEAGEAEQKTANSFAGQTVVLRRRADETVANDFHGEPDSTDLDNLNSLIDPDQDLFPEDAVAVGDSWDVSAKVSKHAELQATDQLLAQCKLDWVKEIKGKKMAQITCSCGIIRHQPGNVEAAIESTSVMQVDMAASQIVKSEQKGTIKYATPKDEAVQVNGTTDFSFTGEIKSTPATVPSTKP
jgi:hypothetical protein